MVGSKILNTTKIATVLAFSLSTILLTSIASAQEHSAGGAIHALYPASEVPPERQPGPIDPDTFPLQERINPWLSNNTRRLRRLYQTNAVAGAENFSCTFKMDKQGQFLNMRIRRSSGSKVIDKDAVALVKKAFNRPLQWLEVTPEILVDFSGDPQYAATVRLAKKPHEK
jgi:TonB family protein